MDITECKCAKKERELRLVRQRALARIGRALVGEIKLERVAEVAMQQSVEALGVEAAALWLADPARRELNSLGHFPPNVSITADKMSYDAPFIVSMVARTGQALIIEDSLSRPEVAPAIQLPEGAKTLSLMAIPLFARRHLIGVLVCVTQTPRRFTPDDLEFNCAVADLFAVAIEKARLRQKLQDRERQVGLLLKATIDAQEQERQRVCLEVHDGVAQTLSAASTYLEILDGQRELTDTVRTYVRNAATLVRRAIHEAEEVIATLHPAALDTVGLVETLRSELMDIGTQTGLHIGFDADPMRLPGQIETALYRIAREAINNVIKHARASEVVVSIKETYGNITLSVKDDGVGFDLSSVIDQATPKGAGLLSMSKRAELLGGSFAIERAEGQGTKVCVEIPLGIREQERDNFENMAQIFRPTETPNAERRGNPVTVLIVDDHELTRQGLRAMLEPIEWMQVTGEAGDATEALGLVDRLHPRVVLMDLRMPDLDGLEAIHRIKNRYPSTAVVVMTSYEDDTLVVGAVQAGAGGYLLKDASRELLINTIGAAVSGGTVLKTSLLQRAISNLAEAGRSHRADPKKLSEVKDLTEREQEVLRLLANGCTNKEIGNNLVITERTVKKHVQSILAKLGASDRTHAAILALKLGLIS